MNVSAQVRTRCLAKLADDRAKQVTCFLPAAGGHDFYNGVRVGVPFSAARRRSCRQHPIVMNRGQLESQTDRGLQQLRDRETKKSVNNRQPVGTDAVESEGKPQAERGNDGKFVVNSRSIAALWVRLKRGVATKCLPANTHPQKSDPGSEPLPGSVPPSGLSQMGSSAT